MDALSYVGAKIVGFTILQDLGDEVVVSLDLLMDDGTNKTLCITVESDNFNIHTYS